jgi:hypothetical protein
MVKNFWLPKLVALGLGCVVAGCGGSARQGQVRTTPPPPPPPQTGGGVRRGPVWPILLAPA